MISCNEARTRMADRLAGSADGELDRHVSACGACRQEWDQVKRTWDRMGEWPEEEPGPTVRARFYQMLEAYEEGLRAAGVRRTPPVRSWWRLSPGLQLAAAACLVVIGVFAGRWMMPGGQTQNPQELAALRSEVQNMRQLVALSLLQQQSASDRLRGVNWSYRVAPSDTEVLAALLRTVNTDSSVNVRLSAVDALKQFGDSPVARRGLAQSLPKQESPLVQVALLEAIRELRDKEAVGYISRLASDVNAEPAVREHARQVSEALQQ